MKPSHKAKTLAQASTDETAFWAWVDSQKVGGWVRYDVDMARALASSSAALVLASAIHKTCIRSNSIHAAGRWFYMSVKDWTSELYLSEGEVTRALSLLCVDWKMRSIRFASSEAGRGRGAKDGSRGTGRVRRPKPSGFGLGLIQRWVTNRLAGGGSLVSHYRVDFARLGAWWQVNGMGQIVLPDAVARPLNDEGAFPQFEEIGFLDWRKSVCSQEGNQFGHQEETSGKDLHEQSNTKEQSKIDVSASVSVAAAGGGCAGLDVSIFDEWAKTDSARAMRDALGREGVSDAHGHLTECMVRMWERGWLYVDLVDVVGKLRNTYETANGEIKSWQGWVVRNIFDGFVAPARLEVVA